LNRNKFIRITGQWGFVVFNLLYLGGCNTVREIPIEVLVPAEVTIPEYIQSVTFVNRSYMPQLAKDPGDTLERPPEDLYILDTILNNKFFLGVFDALNSSPLFKLEAPTAIQIRRTDSIRFPQPLSEQDLLFAVDTLNTDALICLEGYRVKDTIAVFYKWNYYWYDEDYYEWQNKFVFFVEGTTQWRIYDLLNQIIIDEFFISDTTLWTVYGQLIEDAMNEFPEVVDAYREYAYQRGVDFGMRISPSWGQVRRFYFISGNSNLRKAAELADNGKWEEAAVLWKKETDSTNPKIAAKARFNMALYCERKDLIIPAIDWAIKSYELIHEKYTKTYIDILEKRKLNKLKLQEQIPTE
jgi:hypothetical protein